MTVTLLALAASLAPLVLPWIGQGEHALEGGRLCAWVLVPWVALAGLPRRTGAGALPLAVALLLPVLALGVAADLRAERELGDVAATAGAGLALALLLALAARRGRGARLHGALWLLLVPGAAALALTAELAGWERVRAGAAALPLVWIARAARGAPLAPPWVALLAGVLLALAASARARPAGGAP
jgi:hypothetical protein